MGKPLCYQFLKSLKVKLVAQLLLQPKIQIIQINVKANHTNEMIYSFVLTIKCSRLDAVGRSVHRIAFFRFQRRVWHCDNDVRAVNRFVRRTLIAFDGGDWNAC